MATILVIQHVLHERLGTFELPLTRLGHTLLPLNTYDPTVRWPRLNGGDRRGRPDEPAIDGIIVMGGPMSVNEGTKYPFLAKEVALLREAVDARLPILGVCLGAQLLAHALGAPVTNSPQKEIGWYPLMREPGADGDPLFELFDQTETVFQWHGDTFALPPEAVRLASSPLCQEQAFRYRDHVYGLQFHLEVTEAMVRAWMRTPVNKAELAALRDVIDPVTIRRQSPHHTARLQQLAAHTIATFHSLL